jgi:hypothetical protein
MMNAGIETWIATGDANWRVVYPVGKTALDNIQAFVEQINVLAAPVN